MPEERSDFFIRVMTPEPSTEFEKKMHGCAAARVARPEAGHNPVTGAGLTPVWIFGHPLSGFRLSRDLPTFARLQIENFQSPIFNPTRGRAGKGLELPIH